MELVTGVAPYFVLDVERQIEPMPWRRILPLLVSLILYRPGLTAWFQMIHD